MKKRKMDDGTTKILASIQALKKSTRIIIAKCETRQMYAEEIEEQLQTNENITDKGQMLFADVYAKCRKDGHPIEKASNAALTIIKKAGYQTVNQMVLFKNILESMKNITMLIKIRKARESANKITIVKKGKQKAQPGERRTWATGIHEKQPDGSWKRISEEGEGPAKEEKIDILTSVPKSISNFENTVRFNTTESMKTVDKDGKLIMTKRGDENSITLTPEEVEQIKGATIFSHNHPAGNSFSPEDVHLAMKLDIGEIRAIGKLKNADKIFTYSIKQKKDGIGFNEENAVKIWKWAVEQDGEKRSEFQPLVDSGELSPKEAVERHWHEIWEKAADEFGFEYRRQLHEEK